MNQQNSFGSIEMQGFLNTAIKAAKTAGEIQLTHKNSFYLTKTKELNDIVTEVDLLCEKAIMNEINSKYPHHGFKSEETKTDLEGKEWLWVIDPLDGTINYASGLPFYSVSLALQFKNETILGVVFCPEFNELYTACIGTGAFLNAKKITVSEEGELKNSVLSFMLTSHYVVEHSEKVMGLVKKINPHLRGLRLFVSQALELSYIACGKLNGHLCIKSRGFSAAAGVLILREAGGRVTDINGVEFNNNSRSLLASNGKLHTDILSVISV